MASRESVLDALVAGGTASEAMQRVARGPVLSDEDEVQVAFVPFRPLTEWRLATQASGLRRETSGRTALAAEWPSARSRRTSLFAIVPQPDTRVTALLGVGRGSDFRDAYDHLTRSAAPRLMRPYFRQHDFSALVRDIAGHIGESAELRFTKVGHRRWLTRETRESSVRWTDLPFETVLDEAREKGFFFRHVTFAVDVGGARSAVHGSLTRPNVVSLSQLAVVKLGHRLEERLVRHAAQEHDLVTDRSRVEAYRKPKPIVATFEEPVLSEHLGAADVSARFRKFKRSTIAVIHGNPYVHVRIQDLDDGSSFAVLMTSADTMTLIPQLFSSESSFSRLLEFVHDTFGSADFSDAPPAYA